MDITDEMQLSLLDTGLTTEQIEVVQRIIEEAGAGMVNYIIQRFTEESFTQEQLATVLKNLFGMMLSEERGHEVNGAVDAFLGVDDGS